MRYSIGLDIGIASVGFAVMKLDEYDLPCRIERLGSRIFDVAENPKDGASLALPRREARGSRRRIRRRKHRKERIRELITEQGLLSQDGLDSLYNGDITDIYQIRSEAIDRQLTNEEFARVLIHLSQRRGFKSNRKTEKNAEEGKLLKAVSLNQIIMTENNFRTVGEMFYKYADFAEIKRNKADSYSNTVRREDILNEAHEIFKRQREYGNTLCSEDFEEKYCDILSSQRSFDEGPGEGNKNSPSPYSGDQIEKMIGSCTFEEGEKRAAKASCSFEIFSLLQKINHIRLENGGKATPLTNEQCLKLIATAHTSAELNYHKIRKALNISDDMRFNDIKYGNDSDNETAEKKIKFNFLKAYHDMRKALDKVSKGRMNVLSIKQRNEIGHIFTVNKTDDKIRAALNSTDLDTYDIEALIENLGTFSKFGHLSIKALDKIIPWLEQGLTYDKACTEAGYNFKGRGGEKSGLISLKHLAEEYKYTVTSPVACRALSQCGKVINAIIREQSPNYNGDLGNINSPVYINIELSREMSKDFDERNKLDKGMKENHAQNEKLKQEIQNTFKKLNPTGLDIVKLKLYKQQSGICLYSLKQMDISQLFDPGYADIDHIIPYSDSFDDTYKNKVLVLTAENRQKGDRLPLQYLNGKKRDDFIIWVNNSHLPMSKKRNLLKEELTETDLSGFRERNLQDTKTISRFMYNYLADYLKFSIFLSERKRHVTAVNGAVTSMLRKRWGLNKIREDGDTHHALDAAVVACTTQGMINELSRYHKDKERIYCDETGFEISKRTGEVLKERFPQPYVHFTDELTARLSGKPREAVERLKLYGESDLARVTPIFVSRMPSRKVSGAAHKETIKGIGENNTAVKRVALTALKLKDGEIADYYEPAKISDPLLYNALVKRLIEFEGDASKAFSEPFYKLKSDKSKNPDEPPQPVKKVKLCEKSTLNVSVHDKKGVADNDSMVRVDVFHIPNDGYYLVPIYVADTIKSELPNKAIVANKPYEDWKEMDEKDFIFSLYPNDLIFIRPKKNMVFSKVNKDSRHPEKSEKKSAFVYYKSTGINTGSMTVINHDNSYKIPSLGAKTLLEFEKWQVDILGNISKVGRETRQGFDGKRRH
ncbi:MAG: type II CRISPR RNA-guided endonuclease Cas9 [Oscillospiraceae bacterium]|nr:type II CRISPR RNA-guided endonuclease Cas9 [Oscillospiraceae bacterium]